MDNLRKRTQDRPALLYGDESPGGATGEHTYVHSTPELLLRVSPFQAMYVYPLPHYIADQLRSTSFQNDGRYLVCNGRVMWLLSISWIVVLEEWVSVLYGSPYHEPYSWSLLHIIPPRRFV